MKQNNIIRFNFPHESYAYLQNSGSFSPECSKIISDFILKNKLNRIALFGNGSTGQALQKLLDTSFSSFVTSDTLHTVDKNSIDSIIISTSPVHYPSVTPRVKKALNNQPIPIIELFATDHEVPVRIIFETQPRSGTHYVINNIRRCQNLGYGSVFHNHSDVKFKRSGDNLFSYIPDPTCDGYIIKSHFTKTLHYSAYRYIPTIFQISYIFDSYYSWAKLLTTTPRSHKYVLKESSQEWSILQSYFDLNKKWLNYINNKFFLRYEDYYLNFENTIHQLENYLGFDGLNNFDKPLKNTSRMYWSNDYNKYFDRKVMTTLVKYFYPFIEKYWPEKLNTL